LKIGLDISSLFELEFAVVWQKILVICLSCLSAAYICEGLTNFTNKNTKLSFFLNDKTDRHAIPVSTLCFFGPPLQGRRQPLSFLLFHRKWAGWLAPGLQLGWLELESTEQRDVIPETNCW
jgi:hypothetical protein